MFQTVRLSIIRSLFTVHSAVVYVIQVCRQLSRRTCLKAVYKPVWRIPLLSVQWINSWWWTGELSETCRVSCSTAVYKPVWYIPLLSVQWINSWWWRDELSETCRVSWQNKFVKSVHAVGFITQKTDYLNVLLKQIWYETRNPWMLNSFRLPFLKHSQNQHAVTIFTITV
jgi:hypothetical protein